MHRAPGQWLVDGSDTMIASAIGRLTNRPQEDGRGIFTQAAMNTFEVVYYFNPEQRSVVTILPGLIAIILLPSILLSGFMFPCEGMSVLTQWMAEALPATHFMRMMRAIVLREAGLVDVGSDTFWLVCFTIVGLLIASLRFRQRLD